MLCLDRHSDLAEREAFLPQLVYRDERSLLIGVLDQVCIFAGALDPETEWRASAEWPRFAAFAYRPSSVRSKIRSRSNSATRARMPKNIFATPLSVTGSAPISATINLMPWRFQASALVRASAADRKARSSRLTISRSLG
jgi:hypothetical protein